MKRDNAMLLPNFITPSILDDRKKLSAGGEVGAEFGSDLPGAEYEQSTKFGDNMKGGMSIGAPLVQTVNAAVSRPKKHGVNRTSYTVDKKAERAGQGAQLGNAIMPGWGTLIGAMAGSIVGNVEGVAQSKKINEEYAEAYKQDYLDYQSQEDTTQLFARDGGSLPQMPMGGNLENNYNEYDGGTRHEGGGIPIGDSAEVEKGEVRWQDFIFSDTLIYNA